MPRRSFLANESGTTVVELTMGLGLLLFVLSGVFSLHYMGARQYNNSASLVKSRSQAALAIRWISGDVRQAMGLAEVEAAVISADRNELAIYVNADDDPDLEKVRYFVSAGELRRGVSDVLSLSPLTFGTETVRTLADGLLNDSGQPLFRYYTTNGAEATSLPLTSAVRADVRLIGATPSISTRSGRPVTLETKVFLRNSKPL